MKYVKIFGALLAVNAALMGLAGSASATGVTTTTGGFAATPTIHAVSEGGHVSLATEPAPIACASTLEGTVSNHGAGKPASGVIGKLEFTNCTNGWTVTVNAPGTLAVEWTSGHNGTVSSSGATVTAVRHTGVGTITCRYLTEHTHIGTLTGGNPATLKIEAKIPFHSGGGLCGEGSSQWTGNYVTTSALYVAKEPPAPIPTGVTTTTGGFAATPTIHAVNEGGHVSLANSVANIECSSTVEGEFESHGTGPASGAIRTLEFTGCTNSWTVTVNARGSLAVTWTSGHNGTVRSTGATVTAERHTIFGTITCRYSTSNTHIGTLTGGNPATLKIEGKIPFHSGGGLCGEGSSQWTGNYVTTSALYVAKEPPELPTSVTTTTGGAAETPTIHAVNEGGHVSLANSVANIECSSTVEGEVESHGSGPASGAISKLEFTGCTNSWTVTVNASGTLAVTWTSGHNGTVSSTGATVTAERHTFFGTITCRYQTKHTHIGTLTGGNPATLHIEGKIPFHSGGGLCGEGAAQWTGNYVTTSALYVEGQNWL